MGLADRDYMKKGYQNKKSSKKPRYTTNGRRIIYHKMPSYKPMHQEKTSKGGYRPPRRKPKSQLSRKYYDFKRWFFRKKHPYGKLYLDKFVINLSLAIGLIIVLFIVFAYSDILNSIKIWFIELGTVIALILIFCILKNLYEVLVNMRYGIRGLTNGAKLILVILLIGVAWQAYLVHPDINTSEKNIDTANLFNITPIQEAVINITENIIEDTFAPIEPTKESLDECEKLIFKKTNTERRAHGLHDLTWDSSLANIAREHSRDMAQNDFFSHINLEGEDPTMRAIRQGYNIRKELGGGWYSEGIAENIGQIPTGDVIGIGYVSHDPESIATAQVQSWMNSLGHRANILNSQYDRLGVGVAYDGFYYRSTQNFY
jgi:uncharacterized protein YkwD